MTRQIENMLSEAREKVQQEQYQINEAMKNGNEVLAEFYRQREAYWRGECNAYAIALSVVSQDNNELKIMRCR
jgi:phage shock protein A